MKSGHNGMTSIDQGYDVAMIRDFLDHLQCELRVCHAESLNLRSEPSEELADALESCIRRRGAIALVAAYAVERDSASNEEVEKALQLMRAFKESETARYINKLASLNSLFSEALACAEGKCGLVRRFKAKEVIAGVLRNPSQ